MIAVANGMIFGPVWGTVITWTGAMFGAWAAFGLARISWWTFTWTTGLGILPMIVLMVVLGDRLASVSGETWLNVLAGALLAWLAVKVLRKRLPPHRPGRRSPFRPRSGS